MTMPMLTRKAEVIRLPQRKVKPGFTARDDAELERWASAGRRVVFCDGETGPFAMLHDGATSWATWAVAREDGAVLVWNCVSLEDLGRFDCMARALCAVLGATDDESWPAASNVIPFVVTPARPAAHTAS